MTATLRNAHLLINVKQRWKKLCSVGSESAAAG
jgi:hypothetical protein